MSRLRLALALFCSLLGPGAVASAAEAAPDAADQASIAAVQSAIRANRKAVLAVNLGLSADEATRFWPVYDKYQGELNVVNDRFTKVIEDYSKAFPNIGDELATKLIQDYLAAEADRVALRRAYVDDFAQVVPGRTLARFYQIENKLDAVVRYELAARIPVVEAAAAAKP